MDPSISQLILKDRRIAYTLTDRELKVIEVSGAVDLLYNGLKTGLGRSLLELVPELIGSEEVLADILSGNLPRFQLLRVSRETVEGQALYLTLVVLPRCDRRGRIAGLLHVVEDVTELGRMEQRLAQQRNELRLLRDQLKRQNLELVTANTELRHLDEMKSTFVAVAAHELRSPLASINGFVEVLLDEETGPLNSEQREYLEIVESSAGRLLTISDNLLDVMRIEAGRVELVLQPRDLAALVEAAAAEFAPQLEAKAQNLTLRAPLDLAPALCDETRAMQIVGNLLSNASKYTPCGGLIMVTLAMAEEAGFVQVSVADNGVGVAPEEQAQLFQRFFRATSATQTGSGGAGLGLYIARSLVDLHGGRIWFESQLDRGSTFHVTFPIADKAA